MLKRTSMKQILGLIILLMFLSTIMSLVFLRNFLMDMQASTDNLSNFICESTENRIQSQMKNYLLAMDTTAMNPTIQKNIFRDDVTGSEMLAIGTTMRDTVNSITYLLSSGNYFSTYNFFTHLPGDGGTFRPLSAMKGQAWYPAFQENGGAPFITYIYNNYSRSYHLVAVKSIDYFGLSPVSKPEAKPCYQAMTISPTGLFKNVDTDRSMKSYVYLVDYNGELVYKSTPHLETEAQQLYQKAIVSHGNGLSNYRFTPENTRAELIATVTKIDEIAAYSIIICDPSVVTPMTKWQEFLPALLLIGVFVVLLFLLSFFYFNYRKRINRLILVLDEYSENTPIHAASYLGNNDEIGRIGRHVIRLQSRIKTLIEEEYKTKLQNISAQYEALTTCINPHFLYNTLNSVSAMASMEDANKTREMVLSLSDLFRYSADMSKRTVPLSQEVTNIEDYLYIQQIRYSDKLLYLIDIPEELRRCAVPKLILQPLVENCFKHGLVGKRTEKLEIIIGAVRENEKLKLWISDNGAGISPERLENIYSKLKEPNQHSATTDSTEIGLMNVHKRIRLLFGDDYGLSLYSEHTKGTRIELVLKFQIFT